MLKSSESTTAADARPSETLGFTARLPKVSNRAAASVLDRDAIVRADLMAAARRAASGRGVDARDVFQSAVLDCMAARTAPRSYVFRAAMVPELRGWAVTTFYGAARNVVSAMLADRDRERPVGTFGADDAIAAAIAADGRAIRDDRDRAARALRDGAQRAAAIGAAIDSAVSGGDGAAQRAAAETAASAVTYRAALRAARGGGGAIRERTIGAEFGPRRGRVEMVRETTLETLLSRAMRPAGHIAPVGADGASAVDPAARIGWRALWVALAAAPVPTRFGRKRSALAETIGAAYPDGAALLAAVLAAYDTTVERVQSAARPPVRTFGAVAAPPAPVVLAVKSRENGRAVRGAVVDGPPVVTREYGRIRYADMLRAAGIPDTAAAVRTLARMVAAWAESALPAVAAYAEGSGMAADYAGSGPDARMSGPARLSAVADRIAAAPVPAPIRSALTRPCAPDAIDYRPDTTTTRSATRSGVTRDHSGRVRAGGMRAERAAEAEAARVVPTAEAVAQRAALLERIAEHARPLYRDGIVDVTAAEAAAEEAAAEAERTIGQ